MLLNPYMHTLSPSSPASAYGRLEDLYMAEDQCVHAIDILYAPVRNTEIVLLLFILPFDCKYILALVFR